ncbi:unnamed protein product [Aureobasidium vineae]|uniref:BTB domain-containing protein n=1 Tax=Aureobasidium vineae TaxID=2773715 RepID=A0A9N8JMU1_9PEZI|nr:unnamed protein product [Aureobasidium vineae]
MPDSAYDSIFVTALRKSYNSFELLESIVNLRVGDEQVPAHRLLLETASEVFRAAFGGNWNNAATGQYAIEGHSKDVAVTMIKHIYGSELRGIEGHTEDENIRFLLDVYMIGEEYLITSLQIEVIRKIKDLLGRLHGMEDDRPLE